MGGGGGEGGGRGPSRNGIDIIILYTLQHRCVNIRRNQFPFKIGYCSWVWKLAQRGAGSAFN